MPISLLVLIDFHQPANHALNYANALAHAIGAQLVLLHIERDSALDPERLTGTLVTMDTEATNLAFQSLTSQLTVPVLAEIGHGQLTDAVAASVARHQPVLVVVGRSDTDEIPDELVSGTALELLRAAPQPLLVVPPRAAVALLPRQVLLAADAETFSLGGYTSMVRHLFNSLHAQLTVLHVGPAAAATDEAFATEAVERTGLTIDLPPLKLRGQVNDDPAAGILQVAASGEYDLVALIARPRSFLGHLFHRSVTAQVLLHSPVPVLVLPAL